jgi:regulator of RNase E activity RraA
MTSSTEISDRLSKCFSSVIHDVMRDDGFKNFVLNPNIKPNKEKHKIAGQIFTIEGESNTSFSHHETLLAWTGLLSKAPSDKVLICQPNDNNIALMGELSAETLQKKNVLEKSEKLINTESQVRKAIREGMDPQEAYIKYSVF